jgi:hypothetical protein
MRFILFLPGAASSFVRQKAPVDPERLDPEKGLGEKARASAADTRRAAFELQDFGTARWQLLVDATSSRGRPEAVRYGRARLSADRLRRPGVR